MPLLSAAPLLLAFLAAGGIPDHDVIRPMPGAEPTGRPTFESHGRMPVVYAEAGKQITRNVEGRRWHLDYRFVSGGKTDVTVSRTEIMANYKAAAARSGGTIHAEAANRLTFSLPRKTGGTTWCKLYAGTGSYTLDIVDEQALETTLEFGAEQMRAAIERDGRVAVYGILFDTGMDSLKPGSGAVIEEVVKLLHAAPALRLEVQGHTDSTGAAGNNKELSERRAQGVVKALALYGVAPGRILGRGYGAERPVADNATEDGKAKNRRVELVRIP